MSNNVEQCRTTLFPNVPTHAGTQTMYAVELRIDGEWRLGLASDDPCVAIQVALSAQERTIGRG